MTYPTDLLAMGEVSFVALRCSPFQGMLSSGSGGTPMSSIPDTRYAKSADNYVAYQVMGEGPFDLVYVPGFISHLDLQMELGLAADYFKRLASFCRLIRFDKRELVCPTVEAIFRP